MRSMGLVLCSMGGSRSGCQPLRLVFYYTRSRLQAQAGRFGVRLSAEFGLSTR